jgi:uncharacterized protein (TIGR02172 family)
MNRDLGSPIAYGRTAEIYAWQEGTILKLYHDWFDLKYIEYEAQLAQAAYSSGLPVPSVGKILRVNDRNGLLYQRVNGNSIEKVLQGQPWKGFYYARRMAETHAKMHGDSVQVEFPSQRQKLAYKIQNAKGLSPQLQIKALAALETMPDNDKVCHGDFHPGNILTTPQGEIIVDWIDASNGNPLADLARTSILALGGTGADKNQNAVKRIITRIIHAVYIRHYFKLCPGGESEYYRWLPIVAAARLDENIPQLEKWLITQVEKGL